MKIGLSGHFRLEVREARTGKLKQAREFDNLITNSGLDCYGLQYNPIDFCYIGSGMNAPTPEDAQMGQFVGSTNQKLSAVRQAPESPNWVAALTVAYRFNANTIVGNFSEIGIGYGSNPANGKLWSRALIVDEGGSPSTLTIVENEYLDVYYTLYFHPPLGDASFDFQIGSTTYHVTERLAYAANTRIGGNDGGLYINAPYVRETKTNCTALGEITGEQNGVNSDKSDGGYPYRPNGVLQPYSMGAYKRAAIFHYGLGNCNYENGISGLVWDSGQSFSSDASMFFEVQMVISPPIMKTENNELELTVEYGWGRHEG